MTAELAELRQENVLLRKPQDTASQQEEQSGSLQNQMAALKTGTKRVVQVLVDENTVLRQQQQDTASLPAASLKVLSEVVRELRQENELLRQQQSATVREIFVLGDVVQELRRESELMKQQQSVVSQQAENLRALGVVVQEIVGQQAENQQNLGGWSRRW